MAGAFHAAGTWSGRFPRELPQLREPKFSPGFPLYSRVAFYSLHLAYNALQAREAAFWIRTASAAGILIVNGFNILRGRDHVSRGVDGAKLLNVRYLSPSRALW